MMEKGKNSSVQVQVESNWGLELVESSLVLAQVGSSLFLVQVGSSWVQQLCILVLLELLLEPEENSLAQQFLQSMLEMLQNN